MSIRNRMTWAAGRSASAAPATPGYGTEDQEHPAHQQDPAYEKYKKGDPDAWAETPKAPPYPQGNPPATPGYDVEDQDHPAHKEQPRNPKSARFMRAAVERKAAKCLRIARHLLGKKATVSAVEDQALDLMDWSDSRIDSTLGRLAGGFMASDFDGFGDPMVDDFDGDVDDGFLDDDDDLDLMLASAPSKGSELDGVMAALTALTSQVASLKNANQNDPKGPTLAPKAKSEEAARQPSKAAAEDEGKEEDKAEDKAEDKPWEGEKKEGAERKAARKFFASMDTDRDGFVMKADWKAAEDLFAALDTDNDGILAEDEVVAALAPQVEAPVVGLTAVEAALVASMTAAYAKKAKAKKSEDEEDEEEAPAASKKAKAKKSEDEDEEEEAPAASKKSKKVKAKKSEDEEDDEEEAPAASKKAKSKKSEDEDDEEEAPAAAKKAKSKKAAEEDDEGEDEGDDETASKKACGEDAGVFGLAEDPMGLADGSDDIMGDDEEALLASIFGGKAASKVKAKKSEDEDEDDDEEEAPAASKKAKKSEDEDDEGEDEEEAPAASKKAKKSEDEDEDDEEGEDEEEKAAAKKAVRLASRTASQRPQARKASTGVRTVGAQVRVASGGGKEVDDLSRLWESSPDVSKVFGN